MNAGVLSYAIALLAFLALTLLLATTWRGHDTGRRLLTACIFSTLWAGAAVLTLAGLLPPWGAPIAELLRDAFWLHFLLHLLSARHPQRDPHHWRHLFMALLAYAALTIVLGPSLAEALDLPASAATQPALFAWIGLSIFGLVLIEQLFRNTPTTERWAIKHLHLGLGLMFAYDFFLFADTLLFKKLDGQLWMARGGVNALIVPLLALSIARNPHWNLRIHVSRQVVFHSAALLAAGVYLLVMAGAAYLLRASGGTWGPLLQILFLAGAIIVLLVLLFSDRIRARVRVWLSKHFFSFKYDYREEWQRFTHTLAAGNEPVPDRIVHAIADLVDSRGGLLWARNGDEPFETIARRNIDDLRFPADDSGAALIRFLETRRWIVDLDEYRQTPGIYEGLELPEALLEVPNAWLIVPLIAQERLIGILLLRRSDVNERINWEDRDLLKMAALQAATHLAQHLGDQALMQARQFEAFNRLSAYVVHDLKNILAQQSLLVANAERHKDNPAFIDDMIGTIRNSVDRMTRLMEQMRSGMRGSTATHFDLGELLAEIVHRRSAQRPVPELHVEDSVSLTADRERLGTVFAHLIQNAQEATPDDGHVSVRLQLERDRAVVTIEDTGCGMDETFIRTRLFKPFDSTKGLTGMGIGVFESREIVRSLGGEIEVESTPGEGTRFRITIPAAPGERRTQGQVV